MEILCYNEKKEVCALYKKMIAGLLLVVVLLGICTGGVRLRWRTKPMEAEIVQQQVPQLLFTEAELIAADVLREGLEMGGTAAGVPEGVRPEWAETETVEIVGQNIVLDFLGQGKRLLVQYSIREDGTVYLITKTYRASPFVGETVYSAAYDCVQEKAGYEQRVSRRQWLPFLKLFA